MWTVTPLVSMGVMTMKMISSTSITSTMGVTLMSDTGGGACFFSIYDSSLRREQHGVNRTRAAPEIQLARLPLLHHGALRALQEVVDQLGARIAHLHVKRVDAVGEVVEHPDGR